MESVAGIRSVLEHDEPSDHDDDLQRPWQDIQPQREAGPTSYLGSEETSSSNPDRMLFGVSAESNISDSLPNVDHLFLLNVYRERVHALFMVLHWPSTLILLKESNATENVGIGALRSAIYFTSVCSCFDHELKERKAVLAQYRQRAEQAFIDAGLLTTTSFMVLQAFVVYLVSLAALFALLWSLQIVLMPGRQVCVLAKRMHSNGL